MPFTCIGASPGPEQSSSPSTSRASCGLVWVSAEKHLHVSAGLQSPNHLLTCGCNSAHFFTALSQLQNIFFRLATNVIRQCATTQLDEGLKSQHAGVRTKPPQLCGFMGSETRHREIAWDTCWDRDKARIELSHRDRASLLQPASQSHLL